MDSTRVPHTVRYRTVQCVVPYRTSTTSTAHVQHNEGMQHVALLSWCQAGSTTVCCTAYSSMHNLCTFIQVLTTAARGGHRDSNATM
jgi:hypothetical protein